MAVPGKGGLIDAAGQDECELKEEEYERRPRFCDNAFNLNSCMTLCCQGGWGLATLTSISYIITQNKMK